MTSSFWGPIVMVAAMLQGLCGAILELILDVAGAAGHIDACCVKMMTKPVAQAYLTIYE